MARMATNWDHHSSGDPGYFDQDHTSKVRMTRITSARVILVIDIIVTMMRQVLLR